MSIAFVKLEDISLASYEGLYLHIELNKDNINVTLYEAEAEDCKQICKDAQTHANVLNAICKGDV